ncbi:MAG: sodium:proton antiporter [Planctomycetota bacterium]|nr:sodium:proton antiporter [Planctomycetota bacterium]MDA1178238.1 sodium:proton antiporter [Planctomycetota bacterium]
MVDLRDSQAWPLQERSWAVTRSKKQADVMTGQDPHRRVAQALLLTVLAYGIAIGIGWRPTQLHDPGDLATDHAAKVPGDRNHVAPLSEPADSQLMLTPHGDQANRPSDAPPSSVDPTVPPPLLFVLPFVFLLAGIAVFPLVHVTAHWWENNFHRFLVAIGCSVVTLLMYAFLARGWTRVGETMEHAIVHEYLPFIVLLFSLYTISGGIRIEGDLRASSGTNTAFLGTGALLASLIGTTGAAMLLIRPLLETNRERKHVQHTVVFFIFVSCNCGGLLLPIGDPPLFLGYLEGVDFFWTLWHLWQPWLVVNGTLLAMYFALDRWIYVPSESTANLRRDATQIRPLRVDGLWPNAWLLVLVVLCIALLDPHKAFPGTSWHAWPHLREIALCGLVAASLLLGANHVRQANRFNFSAILEVAALFVGIFVCMQPALEILNVQGPRLGIDTPTKLFAVSGILSAVLDNAPTYLVFFRATAAQFGGVAEFAELVSRTDTETATRAAEMLAGISLGAVFMGAMTYIGNGPNFMVRAIAEQTGVRMPSFFGYTFYYAIPYLGPVLILTAWLYL